MPVAVSGNDFNAMATSSLSQEELAQLALIVLQFEPDADRSKKLIVIEENQYNVIEIEDIPEEPYVESAGIMQRQNQSRMRSRPPGEPFAPQEHMSPQHRHMDSEKAGPTIADVINNEDVQQTLRTEGTEEVMIIEESEEEITIDNEQEQPYGIDASRGSFQPGSQQALQSPVDKTSSTVQELMRDARANPGQNQAQNQPAADENYDEYEDDEEEPDDAQNLAK